MNKSIFLSQLELMLWIQFEAPNIYWSSMQHLQKRHIYLQLFQSNQQMRFIKKNLKEYLLMVVPQFI